MDHLHLKSLRSTLQYTTLKYYVVTLFVQRIQDVECTKSNVGMYKMKFKNILNQNDFLKNNHLEMTHELKFSTMYKVIVSKICSSSGSSGLIQLQNSFQCLLPEKDVQDQY